MFLHIFLSFFRIFISLFPAVLVGILLGFIAYKSRAVSLSVSFILNLPKFIFIPISLALFGITEFSKFFVLFLVAVFPIANSFSASLDYIFPEISRLLRQCKIKSKASYLALLPVIFSFILKSINGCLTAEISILCIAECFGSSFGIGFYIIDCWLKLKYPQMIFSIITVCILGSGLNFLLKKISKKFSC